MSIRGRIFRQKTKIYHFLKEHPFLDAMQYVLRNYKNKEICRNIANRNGLVLRCRTYGNDNKNKCIYYICVGKYEFGFFALFRITLKYLAYADRFGFCPVIEWSKDIPYAEREVVMNTKNPYEYYFDQPTNISLKEIETSYNVFESDEIHITDFFLDKEIIDGEDGYFMSEQFIDYLSEITRKYVKLNAWTDNYVENEIRKVINGKKTLGVHVRGSDFKQGYNNHPVIVPIEDYIKISKKMLEEGYEQIFLATDDVKALEEFSSVFMEKLVYYHDVIRTTGKVSVAFSESVRKNHHYLLGLEVLRDMYSLAACDGLVAGISQVSNCARIVKKSYKKEYEDMIILNRGVNHTANNFVR